MGKKLYVGNLTYSVTSSDLQEWFTPFGTVQMPRSSQTETRVAARGSVSSRWTRTPRLKQRSRDSMIKITRAASHGGRSQATGSPYQRLGWW